MKLGWIRWPLIAATLMTTACAPMLRISPQSDTVILLPEKSKAVTVKHFERRESQLMWLFRGIEVMPTDYLAQAAPNQALANVHYKQELDYLQYGLTLALSTAAGVATAVYAPDEAKSLGLLVYTALALLIPERVTTVVEGDVVEPPSDLGQGR
ncbi:MAG TPA: hypothetical protein V6D05_02500 [Stenomitos sp.]